MSNIRNILGKSGSIAKTVVKPIVQELGEIPKTAVMEGLGLKKPGVSESPQESPINEALRQKTPGLEKLDPNNYQEQKKQKLDYLQSELEDLRRKNEYNQQQKAVALQQQEKDEEERNKQKPQIIETAKKKMHMPFGQKKNKSSGTGEILKNTK